MTQEIIKRQGRMAKPPHPGSVLKEIYLKPTKTSTIAMAEALGVDRKTISRIVNARTSITAEMALKIAKRLNTSPEMWLGMQQDYDLWHAEQTSREAIRAIRPMSKGEVSPIHP